eukprot:366009-Chlamydomonas_euryale.AAC.30
MASIVPIPFLNPFWARGVQALFLQQCNKKSCIHFTSNRRDSDHIDTHTHTLNRYGYFFASSSILSLRMMSESVVLAYTSETSVLSAGSDSTVSTTCSMGVMPEPPATMPIDCFMLALYGNLGMGPFISRVSPTLRESMWLPILPSG